MTAFLVVRDGNKWRDVYRLIPGQVMTIGRAATNRIVLHDDICSRNHCELFQTGTQWTIRDLDSRNGTQINQRAITGDTVLKPGQIIRLGNVELAFTHNPSELGTSLEHTILDLESDDGTATPGPDEKTLSVSPEILHRQKETRLERAGRTDGEPRDRTSRELAQLYRLALAMGTATDAKQLTEAALNGLRAATPANIGAILALDADAAGELDPSQLTLLAYMSVNESQTPRVSESVSRIVLAELDAVLARDITTDTRLKAGVSLKEIQVQSVICAPIRNGDVIYGLVHLYSTDLNRPLDREDLDFVLAVADQCAVAWEGLRRQESLADGLARFRDENQSLREQLGIESELVGSSPCMQQLTLKIARIAPTDAAVLVRGESGVGKELVSRAIHFRSRRRNGPFVCMNCAALSESLLESELFGHEKGSFTGATGRKIGKFEQAHRGTLMLDEVGEMSAAIQAKFLRVLEGHAFERVGGSVPIQVDVRVVAATNRNLERAVEEGKFRRDLYFRLQVLEITIAPLRERPQDVMLLSKYFLERFVRKTGRPLRGFTPAALEVLARYDWPGNVRELQNTVERAVILSGEEYVSPGDIQLSQISAGSGVRPPPPRQQAYREVTLDELEQEHILATLERTQWNKSQAAQILGIERSTLDRKLKRYQVARPGE